MQMIPAQFSFSVADGEQVEVTFAKGDLVLTFVDWHRHRVEHRFIEALAFRWASRPTAHTPSDDSTFEVLESPWLVEEVRLDGYTNPEAFAHYVLCFNAQKVLEVIGRRPGP